MLMMADCRNGPAQLSFGSERRHLTSWLDGFAKLHSFKFSGPDVLYSGRMLEPPNYLASVEAGELQPMMTLNKGLFINIEEKTVFAPCSFFLYWPEIGLLIPFLPLFGMVVIDVNAYYSTSLARRKKNGHGGRR